MSRKREALNYTVDTGPGITRQFKGDRFVYYNARGRLVSNQRTLRRIEALAIPPAYTDVWISPDPRGHIQATARDARGRKQYRYHEQWKQLRDANKYQQLEAFGAALPRIRRRAEADMKGKGLTQERITSLVICLLESTLIRIGTKYYARTNKSYGLTTLRRRHASVIGSTIRFQFKGKSGVEHDVTVNDRRIALIIRRCLEIPGQELFRYKDAQGNVHGIDSGAVNAWLKSVSGGDFTAKHYRTWGASVYAMKRLQQRLSRDLAPTRKVLGEVIKETAALLGNTATICRNCYIHPAIVEAYLTNTLPPRQTTQLPRGLSADERRFLAFLRSTTMSAAN
ncbi:MAG TPA: DNA topoisomerase IB [Candidimonas sp.]|nr:DNA topoisomerase IB [Candidimonas sp.]